MVCGDGANGPPGPVAGPASAILCGAAVRVWGDCVTGLVPGLPLLLTKGLGGIGPNGESVGGAVTGLGLREDASAADLAVPFKAPLSAATAAGAIPLTPFAGCLAVAGAAGFCR